jgi:hypothetical protein
MNLSILPAAIAALAASPLGFILFVLSVILGGVFNFIWLPIFYIGMYLYGLVSLLEHVMNQGANSKAILVSGLNNLGKLVDDKIGGVHEHIATHSGYDDEEDEDDSETHEHA